MSEFKVYMQRKRDGLHDRRLPRTDQMAAYYECVPHVQEIGLFQNPPWF